jgi:hypothetical protein
LDDYIIKLSNADHFRTTEWKMTIDIRTLSDLAGNKQNPSRARRLGGR